MFYQLDMAIYQIIFALQNGDFKLGDVAAKYNTTQIVVVIFHELDQDINKDYETNSFDDYSAMNKSNYY